MEVNRTVHFFFFLYNFNSYSLLFTHIFYIFANMKTRLSKCLSSKPYNVVIGTYTQLKKEGDINKILFFKSFVYACIDAMTRDIEHGSRFESYLNMVGSDGLYRQVFNEYYGGYYNIFRNSGSVNLYEVTLKRYILR